MMSQIGLRSITKVSQLVYPILQLKAKIRQLRENSHAPKARSRIFVFKKLMLIVAIILALRRLLNTKKLQEMELWKINKSEEREFEVSTSL